MRHESRDTGPFRAGIQMDDGVLADDAEAVDPGPPVIPVRHDPRLGVDLKAEANQPLVRKLGVVYQASTSNAGSKTTGGRPQRSGSVSSQIR